MKVLVTGASGFVGTRLCRLLEAGGHGLIRVGRNTGSSGQVPVGDIGATSDWTSTLGVGREKPPDAVIHLAARVHVMSDSAADPLAEFRRVNVDGTLNLARQAAAAGVRRFVYASSIKVNGESTPVGRPFQADDLPAPQDAYAMSKCEAEAGLSKLADAVGMEVVIARPPLVYGPGVKGNFASLLRWVCKGVPLPLGAVDNRRSLVALDNLVDFMALCADRKRSPQAAGQVFLIADGEDLSTPDLLRRVAQAYGRRARLVPVPENWLRRVANLLGRSAQAERILGSLTVDISKAQVLLGWRPVVTMEQQLREMAGDAARS